MASLLDNMVWNALEASILALAVAWVARMRKLSAPLRHVLWLMVMFKLLLPPAVAHSFGLSRGCRWAARCLQESVAARAGRSQLVGWDDSASPTTTGVNVGRQLVGLADSAHPTEPLPAYGESAGAGSLGQAVRGDGVPSAGPSADAAAISAQPIEHSQNLAWSEDDSNRTSLDAPATTSISVAGTTALPAPATTDSFTTWLLSWLPMLWLAGSCSTCIQQVRKTVLVSLSVRRADPAAAGHVADCVSLARQLGLRRVPALRVVAAGVPPMLWALGRPVVVLPELLLTAGSRAARRSVLAHELGHLKRRDHWTCWLELVATCVYWWLPTFWWARRQMRRAADEAADAWAVQALNSRQVYAESLLTTVQLLCAGPLAVPTLGRGLGEREVIGRRLTMIMREPLCHRLSWPAWVGTALVGLLVLPAAPGRLRAQDPPKPPDVPSNEEIDSAPAGLPQRPPLENPPPGRRPEVPRPPEGDRRPGGPPEERRGPDRPDGRGGRDAEQRLRELEGKMDRVLHMLEAMQGGPGRSPGGPLQGDRFSQGLSPNAPLPDGRPEAGRGFGGGPPPGAPFPMSGLGQPMFPGGRNPGQEPPHDDIGRMLGALDLSPEQRERVEKVQHDLQAAMQKAQAEFHSRMQELEKRRHEAIHDILTPEQRHRLERMHGEGRPDAERPREGAGRGPAGDRPREGAGRRPDGERPPEGAGRRRPDGERPPEGTEPPRRPERDRPREGGEPPRRPERDSGRDGAHFGQDVFDFFVGLFR